MSNYPAGICDATFDDPRDYGQDPDPSYECRWCLDLFKTNHKDWRHTEFDHWFCSKWCRTEWTDEHQ